MAYSSLVLGGCETSCLSYGLWLARSPFMHRIDIYPPYGRCLAWPWTLIYAATVLETSGSSTESAFAVDSQAKGRFAGFVERVDVSTALVQKKLDFLRVVRTRIARMVERRHAILVLIPCVRVVLV
jgi:hypothetical protein